MAARMVNRISRRQFLQKIGAAVPAAALGLPPSLREVLARPARGRGSLHAIQHVVILMQENRSFDHYFGTLSGVRGFDDLASPRLPNGHPTIFQPDPANGDGYTLPFHLAGTTLGLDCLPDPGHSWATQHESWNRGRVDGWMRAHRDADGPGAPAVMGYYRRADLPFHYALADAFTICDRYFSSALGETAPNRLLAMTGTIDPDGRNGGPIIGNGDLAHGAPLTWTTYPERLERAGISWQVYVPERWVADDLNVLAAFAPFTVRGSSLRARGAAGIKNIGDFVADVRHNRLPRVCWLDAGTSATEHPPFTPAAGARYLYRVLEALASNPRVWTKTVIFCTYDENGGFFDHVAPPTPPAGTPGEYITASLPASANGIAGPIGLGFRVPMLVISPWSRGGWVCGDLFDHTSILRFLEARFGVEEPNISSWRRVTCGDLTSTLQLSHPRLSFPQLPAPPLPAAAACASTPLPIPPTPQQVPHQEAGRRPRRGTRR
ncbi:MAG TPA: alkaline phosphatase family protein [Chloroflexota bacterium]|nr:alkaline phosphatase family protein [Chloroflexota bacterium]